jgi:hypothetical protein
VIFLEVLLLSPSRLLGHYQLGHLDNLVNLLEGKNSFAETRVIGREVNLLNPV